MDLITPETYAGPSNEDEKRMFHVKIEQKRFDAESGERLTLPNIIKVGLLQFQQSYKHWKTQKYDIVILYDPREYLSKLQETVQKKEEIGINENQKSVLTREILEELKKEFDIIPKSKNK